MNTYARSTVSAMKYLDRALEKKLIKLDEVATAYGLSVTRTRLRKQLDGVLEDKQIDEDGVTNGDTGIS